MNFALIGVGSFGLKRAASIKKSSKASLLAIHDNNDSNAAKASEILEVEAKPYKDILSDKNIDTICICAPNKFHKQIIIDSLKSGKNIFCEKPISKNLNEAQEIYEESKKHNTVIQVGSNHRFFESVMFAKKLVDEGTIGEVLSFNGRIGHNGERIKDSWFWKKDISGGGTLLDNGCHLLDLSRYFVGDFSEGSGMISNSYWKGEKIEVEDTAIGAFRSKEGKTANIFCSWRHLAGYLFFELNGSDGYINVDGRFDTHGGDKVFWSSNKDKKIHEKDFSKAVPNSYQLEIENFIHNVETKSSCSPSAYDALQVMKMIDSVYSKK